MHPKPLCNGYKAINKRVKTSNNFIAIIVKRAEETTQWITKLGGTRDHKKVNYYVNWNLSTLYQWLQKNSEGQTIHINEA